MDDEEASIILKRMEEELELDFDELIEMTKDDFTNSVVRFFDELAERADIIPIEPTNKMINRLDEIRQDIKEATD